MSTTDEPQTGPTADVAAPPKRDSPEPPDERQRTRVVIRLLRRPELAAVIGALVVWIFFAVVAGDSGFLTRRGAANYLTVSAQLGIVAVPVAVLMIAGEFDLSVGSMLAAAGMIVATLTTEMGVPFELAALAAFAFALFVGFVNGTVVLRTGLPSFIVTLATLFILRGTILGVTRVLTGRTLIGGVRGAIEGSPLAPLFGTSIAGFRVSIFWWIGITVLATFVLLRTRFGNWIFGAGGSAEAARKSGVPIDRVKLALFMVTASAAALIGVIQTVQTGSADTLRGQLLEFEAIIAAVVGGTLLTGGYGSAVGAFFGALTFGIVSQGIFFAGFNSDWFLSFLGVMLLLAVLANNLIRNKAMGAR